jgi:hypothetical protein
MFIVVFELCLLQMKPSIFAEVDDLFSTVEEVIYFCSE